jgi:hypothetical protein
MEELWITDDTDQTDFGGINAQLQYNKQISVHLSNPCHPCSTL